MSIELTPEGERAHATLRWAQEDPDARAAEAQRQVDNMARPLLNRPLRAQALREVQDAGAMLARLAGSGAA